MSSFEMTVDPQMRIVACGNALAELKGCPSSGLLGLPYYEVVPRICHGNLDAVSMVLESADSIALERYPFASFGATFFADVRIRPLLERGGRVCGASIAVEAQQEGGKASHPLPLVDIGKVASSLAHGIRNPLNNISLSVVFLKNRYARDKTFVEFSDIIDAELESLDDFVTRFISSPLSMPEQGESDLNSLVSKMEELTTLQAEGAGVALSFSYGPLASLSLSPFQVEQALLNIFNEALADLPPGGSLTVETRAELRRGRGFAVCEIRGNLGPAGAAAESPDRPFAREGSGLGLLIAREIVKFHGGMLEVDRAAGPEISVRLCFPVEGGAQ